MNERPRLTKNGTVTTPKGFLANGLSCGIKKSGKPDLGLIYSVVPTTSSGAFTTNKFPASPVTLSMDHLRGGFVQGVIVNSGNANCANGKRGDRDAKLMAESAARSLGVGAEAILVASTGIIGVPLPIQNIVNKVPKLVEGMNRKNGRAFSQSIMTTDTVKKESCIEVKLKEITGLIGGACKGAGMICPTMKLSGHATMLAFLTTDISISKRLLDKALFEAVRQSFNMISVDGDMSTNDSVFILSNGLAGNPKIIEEGRAFSAFKAGLDHVTRELAKKIVLDAEGATKMVEIRARGCGSYEDARRMVRSLSNSMLLKTCLYGEDPNWGRVVSACGASGVDINKNTLEISIGPVKVVAAGGKAKGVSPRKLKSIFTKSRITITIDVKSGVLEATGWMCDLSKKYVDINAGYTV
ncbi:MAG: bifunctional glutamate N-acetyltransferase/amino-acid acetyltransferase ArgJ [Candidatus Omnitrophota bacterium]